MGVSIIIMLPLASFVVVTNLLIWLVISIDLA
jgi:hypothetical protein